VVEAAEVHLVGAVDASVVEQDVDSLAGQLGSQGVNAGEVGDVQGMDGDTPAGGGGEASEVAGLVGAAAAGADAPAVGGVLADELQAEAAVGAGDEQGRHGGPRRGTGSSSLDDIRTEAKRASGRGRTNGGRAEAAARVSRILHPSSTQPEGRRRQLDVRP